MERECVEAFCCFSQLSSAQGYILRRDNSVPAPAGVLIVTKELILHLGSRTVRPLKNSRRIYRAPPRACVCHCWPLWSLVHFATGSFVLYAFATGRNTNNAHRPAGPCALSEYATRSPRAPQRLHSTNVPRRHGELNFFVREDSNWEPGREGCDGG